MLLVSHSQRATADDCWRKWAFGYIADAKTPSGYAAFKGGKMHEVLERWLRDENPYPIGWDQGLDSKTISLIRSFVDRGVTEGILSRDPEQKVEEFFQVHLIPGAQVRGYIDLLLPGMIVDHKTSGSRTWMHNSADTLAKDKQLLTYAYIYFLWNPEEDDVNIRHNQFVWSGGSKAVHAITARVTKEDAQANWTELQDFASKALDLKSKSATLDITADLPEPDDALTCTRKYGGCPYLSICSGSMTLEAFKNQLTKPKLSDLLDGALENMTTTPNQPQEGLISGGSTPPMIQPNILNDLDTDIRKLQAQLYDSDAAWAVPGCELCEGTGWLTVGEEICLECSTHQVARIDHGGVSHGANSDHFDEKGVLKDEFFEWGGFYASLFKLRQDGQRPGKPPAEFTTPEPAGAAKSQAKDPIDKAEDEMNQLTEEQAKETEEHQEAAKPQGLQKNAEPEQMPKTKPEGMKITDAPEEDGKKKRGRKPEGMTLVRGAVSRTKANKCFSLLDAWGEMAAMAGFPSVQAYYQSNAFSRRDTVCAVVELWVKKHPGRMVVWHSGQLSPDLQPVWDVLTLFAQEIYTT